MANSPMLELPELVILLISQQLSYEDLRNLRVTCKRLRETIDQRTPKSLHLFVDGYPFERELIHTGELVGYANTFHVRRLNILKSIKFKGQFSHLLKLTLYHNRQCIPFPWLEFKTVDLNALNYFEQLVHLELRWLKIKTGKLSLRNLKIAHFECRSINLFTINFELDCPQLAVLGLGPRTQPTLTDETGHSVRYLYIKKAKDTLAYLPYKLQNLSTICFSGYGSLDLSSFVLAVMEPREFLSSLKVIQLEAGSFSNRLLKNLLNLKGQTETKHIDIQINWKVMARDELAEMFEVLNTVLPLQATHFTTQEFCFDRPNGDLLRHFNENPILHCLLPCVSQLRICSNEDATLVRQLIGKLRNLHWLILEEGISLDEELFESILKTSRKVQYLFIACSSLKQQQLDRMPDYLQNLRELTLSGDFGWGDYNLEFVAKFKNLWSVRLDFHIEKATMRFLLKNCKYPSDFHLELSKQNVRICRMQSIRICRMENSLFEIVHDNKSTSNGRARSERTYIDSLDDAIEYFDRSYLFNTPWSYAIGSCLAVFLYSWTNLTTLLHCSSELWKLRKSFF